MFNRLRRIMALLTVIFIVVLLIVTIICAVTGSKYFFGMLFLSIVVPIVLWVFMWFTHLVNGNSEVTGSEDKRDDSYGIGDNYMTDGITDKKE
ncbi:MAG: hypothetical protein K2H34_08865 [Lachnospiraceae bacterium]|nr:hypothetical protein [Lachnospiraceae bacterium]